MYFKENVLLQKSDLGKIPGQMSSLHPKRPVKQKRRLKDR
ncbi:hypothetical protein EVA_09847 [gut metagenome]|uniref:Uncharacterized protein n=1 Tax=gut metagenome TaxID=749906 RepID=J9GPZ3_9ZZZZ